MDRNTITIRLGRDDLDNIRLRESPGHELTRIVRALKAPQRHPAHREVLRDIAGRAPREPLAVLGQVISPRGYMPDFIAPDSTNPAKIPELVAATPTDQVAHELELLAADGRTPLSVTQSLLAAPARTRDQLAGAIQHFWEAAVAPIWPTMRAILTEDIRHRSDVLSSAGLAAMVQGLHPTLSWDQEGLHRTDSQYQGDVDAHGMGLVLSPSIFGWPNVQTIAEPCQQPRVFYPAHNASTDWHAATRGGLADLMGPTRAAVLLHLAFPATTTDVATALGLSVSTAHHHLKILNTTGLTSRHRQGTAIWHHRTNLGDQLARHTANLPAH